MRPRSPTNLHLFTQNLIGSFRLHFKFFLLKELTRIIIRDLSCDSRTYIFVHFKSFTGPLVRHLSVVIYSVGEALSCDLFHTHIPLLLSIHNLRSLSSNMSILVETKFKKSFPTTVLSWERT